MNIEELQRLDWFSGWQIKGVLGEGGFGKVYEIEKNEFGITIRSALKIITIPKSADDVNEILSSGMDKESMQEYFRGYVDEFIRECSIMSKLKGQSHIVSLEDYQILEHKNEFGWDILIRMELLTPLTEYMKNYPMSRDDILKLGIDLCEALELCKKNNIIHRDIKPANIFVTENGDYKLGDFGVSRIAEKAASALTRVGTKDYIAPEVFNGKEYNGSVDIYSLGLVLYRLFNHNRLPFLSSDSITVEDREKATIKRLSGEVFPKPAEADDDVFAVIQNATAYYPNERYQDPSEFKRDLEIVKVGGKVPKKKLTRKKSKAPIFIVTGCVGLLLFLLIIIIAVVGCAIFGHSGKKQNAFESVDLGEMHETEIQSNPEDESVYVKSDYEYRLKKKTVTFSTMEKEITEFDENGNAVKIIFYAADGKENGYTENKYDSKGNLKSRISYNKIGKMYKKETFIYDGSGRVIEHYEYGPDDELSLRTTYYYIDDVTAHETIYNPDFTVWSESDIPASEIDFQIAVFPEENSSDDYEYDDEGNLIKYVKHDNNGNVEKTETFEYEAY